MTAVHSFLHSETIICLPSSHPFNSRHSSTLRSFDIDSAISGLLSVQQETKME